jgi:hypothetical protein
MSNLETTVRRPMGCLINDLSIPLSLITSTHLQCGAVRRQW